MISLSQLLLDRRESIDGPPVKAPELPQDFSEELEVKQATHSVQSRSITKSKRQHAHSSVIEKRMNLERRKDSLG